MVELESLSFNTTILQEFDVGLESNSAERENDAHVRQETKFLDPVTFARLNFLWSRFVSWRCAPHDGCHVGASQSQPVVHTYGSGLTSKAKSIERRHEELG